MLYVIQFQQHNEGTACGWGKMKRILLPIIFLVFCLSSVWGLEFSGGSAAIAKVEFIENSKDGVFYVYFTSNPEKGYEYKGMTADLFNEWKDAPSRGKFYHSRIKGKYNK